MVLAKGDYTAQFDGRGFYEIVRLSQTLNKVAEDLGKVEGLRRELLANVSHDLRTPLALIYSYAEMMHDFPQEITAEQTQTIMDETQRLTTLVNDVLDISKLETAMDSLNITNFNLTKNIEETASRVEELLKSEGFRIIFSKGELGEIYVHGDETKINRAFYNLLVNAVNYSGESKTIQVEQIEIDNRIRIQIKDSGEGISPAELPLIWSKYKSGKNGKFDKIGKFGKKRSGLTGMGLGLHIVKTIIERHGWRCGVQSVVGAGSVFWFEVSGDI
ncbi:MAG: HAMP domain-containing histidine kinase [Firmicutes bacterium]|nr:HAMP domain-containing histidine kinase [Bacillota bacterium]